MAIQLIQGPQGQAVAAPGPMSLPAAFNAKLYAAKWVKEGPDVAAAAQREWLLGTQLTADGWEVWRNVDNKPYKVPLKSGIYILLYRLRTVQDGVNAIYGNLGKERLLQERRGDTTGGVPTADPGMLSDERLSKVLGPEDLGEGDVKMNPVPDVKRSRVEAPTLQVSTRRPLPTRRQPR